ncbi:MAG: Uma2 family endonuclease [Bacteroidetes bacterium QH_2_63_10]|nr:MAG: Uma2 family endonuclease [Bacteroidetes bacterium QH_2_63_10]
MQRRWGPTGCRVEYGFREAEKRVEERERLCEAPQPIRTGAMPTPLVKQQAHWKAIAEESSLQDLPYKVETNDRGQILLSPHPDRHSRLKTHLFLLLQTHVPDRVVSVEYALATPKGIKDPDVVWMSSEREAKMRDTGDPASLAPEICIEAISSSNAAEETERKRGLYRDIGADEVWAVDENGRIRFFGTEELGAPRIAPSCPAEGDGQ